VGANQRELPLLAMYLAGRWRGDPCLEDECIQTTMPTYADLMLGPAFPFPFPFPFCFPFPAAPLTRQALTIPSMTSLTPSPFRTLVNNVGPPSRIAAASLRITSRLAPTYGARSVWPVSSASHIRMRGMDTPY
jgi:hypothetical protein